MHEQLHEISARNKYESSFLKKYCKVQNKWASTVVLKEQKK